MSINDVVFLVKEMIKDYEEEVKMYETTLKRENYHNSEYCELVSRKFSNALAKQSCLEQILSKIETSIDDGR